MNIKRFAIEIFIELCNTAAALAFAVRSEIDMFAKDLRYFFGMFL